MTQRVQDPRMQAFCNLSGPDVFHGVTHLGEIWNEDPFDVSLVHQEARVAFSRLLTRATTKPLPASGRILLLKGDSGAGKTHLLRAFRSQIHRQGVGYFSYMQMITQVRHYGRYILHYTLDSLDKPYYTATLGPTTGLMRLANSLVETIPGIRREVLQRTMDTLRHDERLQSSAEELGNFVCKLADLIVRKRFPDIDVDLVRAFLYLQRDDAALKQRIFKYLRCEPLTEYDRKFLQGVTPRHDEDCYLKRLVALGQLIAGVEQGALIISLDQLEDMYIEGDTTSVEQFRQMMKAVIALSDQVPTSIVVISCLSDLYTQFRTLLTQSALDRIEHDPTPIPLRAGRSQEEIEHIIAKRLEHLYQDQRVAIDPQHAIYPFSRSSLGQLAQMRTRAILNWCQEQREKAIRLGYFSTEPEVSGLTYSTPHQEKRTSFDRTPVEFSPHHAQEKAPLPVEKTAIRAEKSPSSVVVNPSATPPPQATPPSDVLKTFDQRWNSHRVSIHAPADTDEERLALLSYTIEACSHENLQGVQFQTRHRNEQFLEVVTLSSSGQIIERLLIGICNRPAIGGGLGRQIEILSQAAQDFNQSLIPVAVRDTEFPANPNNQITKEIGEFIAKGGRRIVIHDSDWRTMTAMPSFRRDFEPVGKERFLEWLKQRRPLTSAIPALRLILNLDSLTRYAIVPKDVEGLLVVGHALGDQGEPVVFYPDSLMQHAIFLGVSGSGKTTLTLNLVEQLLSQKVPAILLDRKGDLCRYADPVSWNITDIPERVRLRQVLQENTNVTLYTPGKLSRHPLRIPIVPAQFGQLPSHERDQVAYFCATALGGMMNYRPNVDKNRLTILAKAMSLLGQMLPNQEPNLDQLVEVISGNDPALIQLVGELDSRHFMKVAEDLETLRLTSAQLFSPEGKPLTMDRLLGQSEDSNREKTPLSIISTSFLGDMSNVFFFVCQLLLEVIRFAKGSPFPHLRAVIVLDEAELYFPATGKPATKEPLEQLLKIAARAGIGIILSSQSPSDVDYKVRELVESWFLGRIVQPPIINRIGHLFRVEQIDLTARLPVLETGEFVLIQSETATTFAAQPSLIRAGQMPEDKIAELAR